MITVFGINSGKLVPLGDSLGRPDDAIWIDLFRPTPEEEALVERQAGLDVQEITGLRYNPFSREGVVGSDTDINYLLRARRLA